MKAWWTGLKPIKNDAFPKFRKTSPSTTSFWSPSTRRSTIRTSRTNRRLPCSSSSNHAATRPLCTRKRETECHRLQMARAILQIQLNKQVSKTRIKLVTIPFLRLIASFVSVADMISEEVLKIFTCCASYFGESSSSTLIWSTEARMRFASDATRITWLLWPMSPTVTLTSAKWTWKTRTGSANAAKWSTYSCAYSTSSEYREMRQTHDIPQNHTS